MCPAKHPNAEAIPACHTASFHAHVALARGLGRVASRLYRTPHDAAVLRIHRLIAELYPDSPEAQEYYGDVLVLMDKRHAAIDSYNRGIAAKNRHKKASVDDKARYAAFLARKIGRIPPT